MSNYLKSIIFATILCIVCSVLLTAANTGLKSYQQYNMEVDRHRNILMALDMVKEDQIIDANHVETLYNQSVKRFWVDARGDIQPSDCPENRCLPLYVQLDRNDIRAYVVPINTRGLWGKIHGYLALENDGSTIRGFTVYQHSETPGLGGEIESRWFRKNFTGKKIIDADGEFASINIAKGAAKNAVPPRLQPNYVDGISGATMTGRFLSAGIKEILKAYEPMAIQFRHKNPRYLRTQ